MVEQCESMVAVEKKLKEMEIDYVRATVEEGGIQVDQLFFHDPDGFMIEICNCDSLPVIPLVGEVARSCSLVNLEKMQNQQQIQKMLQQLWWAFSVMLCDQSILTDHEDLLLFLCGWVVNVSFCSFCFVFFNCVI